MVVETIFENRFMHVQELQPPGRGDRGRGQHRRDQGRARLEGATIMATDLRASACLVIAGLVAQGETIVDRIYHLDRGYERIEAKLSALGAADTSFEVTDTSRQITRGFFNDNHRTFQRPHLRRNVAVAESGGHHAAGRPGDFAQADIATNRADVRLIIVRATDMPTYVQYGAADLGVAGKDVLNEHGGNGLYQPLDLSIARCRMMVAVPKDFDYESAVQQGARLRVATKYVQTAREHFAAKGVHVDLIKLYGSMELAPLVGLSDAIVDLVSSGNTLKANHLKAVEHICRYLVAPDRQSGGAEIET